MSFAQIHAFGMHRILVAVLQISFRQVNLILVNPSGKQRSVSKKGEEKWRMHKETNFCMQNQFLFS